MSEGAPTTDSQTQAEMDQAWKDISHHDQLQSTMEDRDHVPIVVHAQDERGGHTVVLAKDSQLRLRGHGVTEATIRGDQGQVFETSLGNGPLGSHTTLERPGKETLRSTNPLVAKMLAQHALKNSQARANTEVAEMEDKLPLAA